LVFEILRELENTIKFSVLHQCVFVILAFNKTHDMKNTIVLIGLMLLAVAGFSQMSKADAAAFLVRNPVENVSAFNTWEGGEKTSYAKEMIVSLKAMESGFSLVVKQNGVDREKFYPYASIKFITVNATNEMGVTLRN
jgi:hypothetical protein